jgi:hypothetical protein
MGFHYKYSLQVHHRHNDHQRDLQTVVLVYLYHHDVAAAVHHPNPGKKEGLLVAMGNSPHHVVVVVVGGDSQVLKGTEDSFPRVVKGDHFGHQILVGVVDVDVVGGGAKMRYSLLLSLMLGLRVLVLHQGVTCGTC